MQLSKDLDCETDEGCEYEEPELDFDDIGLFPLFNALKKWQFSIELFSLYGVPFTALSMYRLQIIDEEVTAWYEFVERMKSKGKK